MQQPNHGADRKEVQRLLNGSQGNHECERSKNRVDPRCASEPTQYLSKGQAVEQAVPEQCPTDIGHEVSCKGGQNAGGGKQQRDVRERRDEKERNKRQLLRRGVVATELEPNLKNECVPKQQAERDNRFDVSFVGNEGSNR